MIVAASRMLTYLQPLQWCPVQNREIKFYKGFFRKDRNEISNILSIKKENIIWNDFPKQYTIVNLFFPSGHTAILHAFTTLRNP